MSYTPQIIIDFSQLQKNWLVIDDYCQYEPEKKRKSDKAKLKLFAYNELKKYLEYQPTIYRGQGVIIVQPELTSLNRMVRDILDELKIYNRIVA